MIYQCLLRNTTGVLIVRRAAVNFVDDKLQFVLLPSDIFGTVQLK